MGSHRGAGALPDLDVPLAASTVELTMTDKLPETTASEAPAAERDRHGLPLDTRRGFVERLAKTAALPVVLPLMLSMSTAALA
jgi:hypothetical protein